MLLEGAAQRSFHQFQYAVICPEGLILTVLQLERRFGTWASLLYFRISTFRQTVTEMEGALYLPSTHTMISISVQVN